MNEEYPSSDLTEGVSLPDVTSGRKLVLVTGGHGFIVRVVIGSSFTDLPNFVLGLACRSSSVYVRIPCSNRRYISEMFDGCSYLPRVRPRKSL